MTATVASEVYKAAQPALLYLVPFTLLPIIVMAYLKVPAPCHDSNTMGTNGKSSKCVNLQLLPNTGLMDKYPYFKSSIIFRTNMGCASKTIISGKTIYC